MFSLDTLLAFFLMVSTFVNFISIIFLSASGALDVGQRFIAFMIWFYGTLVISEHIWFDGGDDDDYAE